MYQVIKGNTVMAYVDQPVFIRLHENGCYVPATEEDASGAFYSKRTLSYPWQR